MLRYLRLYGACVRFSFSRALEFRLDFFFRVLMDVIWVIVNLAFFDVLHRHTPLLGGWDQSQVRVFAAGLFVVDAVHMTVFSSNLWWFPTYVNRGDLDYHLLRPVSSLFFLMMREFSWNSFLNLLLSLGVLMWALQGLDRMPDALHLSLYGLSLLLGVLLHAVLLMAFHVPVFWLHGSSGLRELSFSLDRAMGRPDGLFTGWVRRALLSILPFGLIVSFPTRALFEGDPWLRVGHLLLVTVLAFSFLLFLWRRGLRAYSSASS